MTFPRIDYGNATVPGSGSNYKNEILPPLDRLFERFGRIAPTFVYSFNAADKGNSIFYAPLAHMAVGDLFFSLWADVNQVPGSNGCFQVVSLETGEQTPSMAFTISSGKAVFQAAWAKLAFVQTRKEIDLGQLFVNTNAGTAMQGRVHSVRDLGMLAIPKRRTIQATGELVVGAGATDGFDMKTASFDFYDLRIRENSAGTPGYLLRVGDPDSGGVLEASDFVHSRSFCMGLNDGPSSTSGPNGTPGFDFQGAPGQNAASTKKVSLATGVLFANCDSVEHRDASVSRCAIGFKFEGNCEKQNMRLSATLCGTAIEDYTTKGSPDSNFLHLTSNLCKVIFDAGEDSTGHIQHNCEARLDDGSSFPAAYDSSILIPSAGIRNMNGKGWKHTGEYRSMNGRCMEYVDRATSRGGFGSDTYRTYLTGIHNYGSGGVYDRVQYIEGTRSIKDNGPGRQNYADQTSRAIDAGFELNEVQKGCSAFNMVVEDCWNAFGVRFGNSLKGLGSIDKRVGPVSIHMREVTGLKNAEAGTDLSFIQYGAVVDKWVRGHIPFIALNHDLLLTTACQAVAIELPEEFVVKRRKVVREGAATADIVIRGSLTAADLASIAWAWAGVRAECVTDMGGRPAIYDGSKWTYPTFV